MGEVRGERHEEGGRHRKARLELIFNRFCDYRLMKMILISLSLQVVTF